MDTVKKVTLLAVVSLSSFALGLLVAPKSGRETRREIKENVGRKVREIKSKVRK
jgi:gas vesicle protein